MSRRPNIAIAALMSAAFLGSGCGGGSARRQPRTLRLSSPAFSPGGAIPSQYTCDGRDVSLPLRWSGVPTGTRQLVLVMRDPDAPGGSFIHWSLSGISPTVASLSAGQPPPGAVAGKNGFGTLGYGGPCPPRGEKPHHYVITLRAIGTGGGHQLASGTLVGTYARR